MYQKYITNNNLFQNKFISFVFTIILLFTLLFSNNIYADEYEWPCWPLPDDPHYVPNESQCGNYCKNVTWQLDSIGYNNCNPPQLTMWGCSGCRVIIYFYKRVITRQNCPGANFPHDTVTSFNEVELSHYALINCNSSQACNCPPGIMSDSLLFTIVADLLLTENYTLSSGNYTRFFIGQCWDKWYDKHFCEWVFGVCDPVTCCYGDYYVYKNQQGVRYYLPDSIKFEDTTKIGCHFWPYGCQWSGCDKFPWGEKPDFGKQVVFNNSENQYLTLTPNPAGNQLNIEFYSEEQDNFTYDIFDISGNKFISKKFENIQSLYIEKIDISKLATGTYIFVISNSVGKIVQEKFVKSK